MHELVVVIEYIGCRGEECDPCPAALAELRLQAGLPEQGVEGCKEVVGQDELPHSEALDQGQQD